MPINTPTKKRGVATVKKIVGTCMVYSDVGPMVCPLCGVQVPKSTMHTCEKKENS